MSSPARLLRDSSPAGAPGRRRSQFTYRQLSQLASYATTCPLRVVAHIDLDAFYAQCEMVRLDVAEDQPLAVQQWQGLIAINYPARKFGIGRMCTVDEAKKLCPDIICQHVATWKEGDEKWAYHDDAAAHITTHKVSLDPYRLESRKILATIKDCLPANLQKVEKASIDEVFCDLSAQVHSILLERFPELARLPPYDDPTEKLPLPSISALDWRADALVDLDDSVAEMDDPDWDDVAIFVGSEIIRDARAKVWEKLKYTCSAGVANNKLLSKLGSGHKKPNQQTVIRNRAVRHFMSEFKFTQIRNLGGKLGEQVVQMFNTETVEGLLPVPMEQLKSKLGDDTGVWVHNAIRGVDSSEVNSRTQIKSMLSAKSFRPSVNSSDQAVKWLRIFVADIFSRLVEEGVLENKRRPKTITLHHRHGGHTRSRQSPIPQGKALDEDTLFNLSKHLLNQIVLEGTAWPCANLSLSVGGFEDGVAGNMGIGAFLVKGEEAQALKADLRDTTADATDRDRPAEKRQKTSNGSIQRFFPKKATFHGGDKGDDDASEATGQGRGGETSHGLCGTTSEREGRPEALPPATEEDKQHQPEGARQQRPITDYLCSRCNVVLETAVAFQSHQDWHLAKDLQDDEERGRPAFASRQPSTAVPAKNAQKGGGASSKRGSRPKKAEAGQSKLKFG